MDDKYLHREISFIKDGDIIESVNDSFSGALTLKINRNNKCFFFKLYNNKNDEIKKIKEICDMYSSVTKNCLRVIDCGVTTDNKVWFVFNWIDGLALNKLYNSGHDFYKYGYSLGKVYKTINENYKNNRSNNSDSIHEALEIKDNFNALYIKEQLLYKNFDKKMLNIINNVFLNNLSIFKNMEKEYIHGDFHPKNVMIDNNGNLVLIDIDSFRYDYFIYNFRWSISSIYKYDDNKAFFKGFIDGRYGNNVPANINKQLIFILIFKFYEQMVSYYTSNKLDVLKLQIKQYNELFSKLDLDGNINILD